MDMPSKKEGCVATQSYSSHESLPRWLEEELNQTQLLMISHQYTVKECVLTVWHNRVRMKVTFGDMLGKIANEESPMSPRVTLFNAAGSTGSRNVGATGNRKLIIEKLDLLCAD